MKKTKALELLGGTVTAAAALVRLTPSAVSQWPDELTQAIEDRVLAALARKHLPAAMLGVHDAASVATPGAQEPSRAG